VPFLTVGYPKLDATPDLVQALVDGGADLVELGIPFSDPLADGVTIQRADLAALGQGVTSADCLKIVDKLRSRGLENPLLLMGYYNPILAYGPEAFAAAAAAAGADGLIVVDLAPEESEELRELCLTRSLDLIYLLAPT
jgi:tryptophan synthase alpha chain